MSGFPPLAGAPNARAPESAHTEKGARGAADQPAGYPPLLPPNFQDYLPHLQNLAAAAAAGLLPQIRRKKSDRWESAEDARLLAAVEEHGCTNWALVAQLVGGSRTRAQCAQRWHRVIDPKIDKSNWSEEEEQKLIRLVSEHGDKSWTRIAAEMGSRSDVQCRFRYKFWVRKTQRTASDVLLNPGQSGLSFPALPE